MNRMRGTKRAEEKISKNQKMKCHPAYCPIAPPIIGAIMGARMPPREAKAM
jgi:hypothetical protein